MFLSNHQTSLDDFMYLSDGVVQNSPLREPKALSKNVAELFSHKG